MMGSSAAIRRVAVATAGLLVAGVVAASAFVSGASGDADGPTTQVAAPGPPASHPVDATAEASATTEAPAEATTTSAAAPPATAAPRPVMSSRATAPAPAPAPAGPTVKQPPPRPNRAGESSPASGTRDDDTADRVLQPAPDQPSTTARHDADVPDPFVFRAGPWWYAVSTQRGSTQVPLLRSADLVRWEERGDALAALPRWARFGATWAPSVLAVDGGFVLHYSTTEDATGLQCLSSAFSVLPDGPYVDASTEPLVCQRDRGGSIDPSSFRAADGRPWLVWKSEGTLDGEPTRIWSQRLSDDGRALVGAGPAELLTTALAWEGPIVEAPSMLVAADGTYHLFYSGNRWETSAYGIGHARCAAPAGPCTRSTDAPVISAHPSEAGAGGAEVFLDGATWRVVYHAWEPSAVGYPSGVRKLRIGTARLGEDGVMRVEPIPR